jgi:hypothetical protein
VSTLVLTKAALFRASAASVQCLTLLTSSVNGGIGANCSQLLVVVAAPQQALPRGAMLSRLAKD